MADAVKPGVAAPEAASGRGPAGGSVPPSPRKALWFRLVVSPLFLVGVVAVLRVHAVTGNPLPTDLLFVLFGTAAGLEMAFMLRGAGRAASPLLAGLACAALSGVGLLAPDDPAGRMEARAALVALALVLAMAHRLKDTAPAAIDRIASTLLPVVFVGLLFSFLRETADGALGAERLVWIVVVAKASDMGGWLVGKPLGRHRMIPSVSPGKTWEGFAGSLVASVLCALFLPGPLGLPEAEWGAPALAGFGLVLALAAVLAGVMQSGWKRRCGVKDSSRLLPELGGILDMVDSLLLAGPVAWAIYRFAG